MGASVKPQQLETHKRSGKKSNFDGYRPAVAEAMHRAGMQGVKDLVDAVVEVYDAIGDTKDRHVLSIHVSTIISNINQRSAQDTFLRNDYSDLALMISSVLGESPEVLFGCSPREPVGPARFVELRDEWIAVDQAPDQAIRIDDLRRMIDEAMTVAGVTDRERLVLNYYYGLNGQEPKSTPEIAEELGWHIDNARHAIYAGRKRLQEVARDGVKLRAHYDDDINHWAYRSPEPEVFDPN